MTLVDATGAPVRRLLVCLDLQWLNAPVGSDPGARTAHGRIANSRRVLAHAREWDWSICHVHGRETPQSRPSRPIAGLEPRPSEPVMTRDGVSAFSSWSFRELVEGASGAQLVIIGFSWPSSCLATVFSARDRGLAVVLVEDAIGVAASWGPEARAVEAAARAMAATFAALTTTDALVGRRPPLRLVAAR